MIKANTCPFCGAPYGIAYGGCRDNCPTMQIHQRLVQEAIDADLTEADEVLGVVPRPARTVYESNDG